MKLPALAAVAALAVVPATTSPAPETTPATDPSPTATATATGRQPAGGAWSVAEAGGAATDGAVDAWWELFALRQAKGAVTVSAASGLPVRLKAIVSVSGGVAEVTGDAASVALTTSPAVLTVAERTDREGTAWLDVRVYTVTATEADYLTFDNVTDPHPVTPGPDPQPTTAPTLPPDPGTETDPTLPPDPDPDPGSGTNPGGGTRPGGEVGPVAPPRGQDKPLPVVDVTPEEAAVEVVEQVEPSTVVTLSDGTLIERRVWSTPDGTKVTQITTRPTDAPDEQDATPSPGATTRAGGKPHIQVRVGESESPLPAPTPAGEDPSGPPWALVGGGLLAAVVVGGSVLAVRRKNAPNPTPADLPRPEGEGEQADPLEWLGGGGRHSA